MTNISKKPLKKAISEKILKQFVGLISDLNRFNKTSNFVEEFFTESEKIMFAKRLAIIFLLLEDFPDGAIVKILNVSYTTVNKTAVTLDRKGYLSLEKYFKDKKNRKQIFDQLEIILRAGMPPMGKGRWARVNKILSEK